MALYAFDGTWNDSSAPDNQRDTKKDTNVHRFRLLYAGYTSYADGVGTRLGFIGKYVGGLTGTGADKRIREQFGVLTERLHEGDTTIDIIGYSRGAAIARMFVHRIEQDFELLDVVGKTCTSPPPVRFLGLFDTVASFGIPWDEREHNFTLDIPEFVQNTFHAMALDETRETFGIERCLGNRNKITEVWFRGGHGDIGGNATYVGGKGEVSNRNRSDIALNWMLAKAKDCGLPVPGQVDRGAKNEGGNDQAPVTAMDELISIGNAGTLSRRIHRGDLVHNSVEVTELTRGINGRLLRRIDVSTRIEDVELEKRSEALHWVPSAAEDTEPDNVKPSANGPSLVELSSRRYPFDVLPARRWSSWLDRWDLDRATSAEERQDDFWAPHEADRALAWEVYVELVTRITTQELGDAQGSDKSALESVYSLFPLARGCMRRHGPSCANTGTLLTAFLNEKVRPFTTKWHRVSVEEEWSKEAKQNLEFRTDLKKLQSVMGQLSAALSDVADARL